MNLIENAHFMSPAGERVPMSNNFTITGSKITPAQRDGSLAKINKYSRSVQLLRNSYDITIKVEREDPYVNGNMALSFYAKGPFGRRMIITAVKYNGSDAVESTTSKFIQTLPKWERYTNILIPVTEVISYLTLKFESFDYNITQYMAMPQLEEGDESSGFEFDSDGN